MVLEGRLDLNIKDKKKEGEEKEKVSNDPILTSQPRSLSHHPPHSQLPGLACSGFSADLDRFLGALCDSEAALAAVVLLVAEVEVD